MNNIQLVLNAMTEAWKKERAETQMTLGKFIDVLKELPPDFMIYGLGELDSYRGYYSDLAFEPTHESRTADDLLTECQSAMGKVFQGYKGGDFLMGENTPLWIAPYGGCGKKVMGIGQDGIIETEDDD